MPSTTHTYDVALSFSTPDTSIAEQLYDVLHERGIETYYYIHRPGDTLGADLKKALRRIYGAVHQVVIIHSRHYETPYTTVELAAALTGAAGDEGIFPLLLDNHPLPHALQGHTYWKIEQGLELLVALIAKQLARIMSQQVNVIQTLVNTFEMAYQVYRTQLEKTTALAVQAATCVLPRDVEKAEPIAREYTTVLSKLAEEGTALRKVVSDYASLLSHTEAGDLAKLTVRLEDIAVKSLDYQVQKLGRPEDRLAYLPFETVVSMRKGTAAVLMNYNKGFTESLFKYDALFGRIRDHLSQQITRLNERLQAIIA